MPLCRRLGYRGSRLGRARLTYGVGVLQLLFERAGVPPQAFVHLLELYRPPLGLGDACLSLGQRRTCFVKVGGGLAADIFYQLVLLNGASLCFAQLGAKNIGLTRELGVLAKKA